MEQRLVAAGQRRTNALALGRFAPIGGSGDGAVVSGDADQHRLAAILFTRALADIQFTTLAHFGCARVTEVCIMLPDSDFRAVAFSTEMTDQRVKRFGHVSVAQIP